MKHLTASVPIVLGGLMAPALGQPPAGVAPATPEPILDWASLEPPVLTGHVQLTHRDRFSKAGEAYFNADATWVIFQAEPVPQEGQKADPFYAMYVAKVKRDADGRITGLEEPIQVSPPGSANTCGWFHPTEPGRVLFGSTLVRPSDEQRSGFQVAGRRYVWQFPEEMEVCTRTVAAMLRAPVREALAAGGEAEPADLHSPVPLFSRPAYDAECSYSADGRFVLYAHVREQAPDDNDRSSPPRDPRPDADIYVYDTQTGQHHALVTADGYDGGPFFSPDGRRICYRSDRKLNDRLQLFIADLKFESGVPVGIEREYQITDNSAVNWAPYWHPSGRFIVYGTSEVSHMNYEVYAIEINDDILRADSVERPAAGLLKRQRLTQATGADILPVFSHDGRTMMWTAQRGPMIPGESKPSSQLWVAEFNAEAVTFGR